MGKRKGGKAAKAAKPASKQHVEVIARSRPLNRKELDEGCTQYCIVPGPDKGELATVKLNVEAGEDAGIGIEPGTVRRYAFNVDRAFYEDEDNVTVYDYLGERVLDRAFGGYHACLLAYGQTGSGKTHTILGDAADPGIIPRLSAEIFARVAASETKTEVVVEMVEIYGKEERMSDLLSDSKHGDDTRLKLRQHDPTTFYVAGTRTYQPTDNAQMDAFVQAGVDKRTVAETQMNHQSSRSHSILTISIRQHLGSGSLREGKIRLVDLAGSENLDRSGAEGKQADEAIAINSSLSVLRRVLDALAEKKEHVPFRDSVLTKLLAESLVGNCMTTIITTVSPATSNAAESKSTLGYGATARKIKTQPVVNDSDEKWRVKELEAEVERLRAAGKAGGGSGGLSEADALAMAEEMLAKEREEQESELKQLQQETRERLEKMKATQAKLAAASADQDAAMAQEHAALQQKVSVADEREQRLLALEAKLAAREQELEAKENEARDKEQMASAAVVLQAVCRRKIQMAFYAELLPRVKAVRVLQSFVRCWRARQELERRRKAAFYGSAAVRGAAATVQAGWRGHKGRGEADRWRREQASRERTRAVQWGNKQADMRREVEEMNSGIFTPENGSRSHPRMVEPEPQQAVGPLPKPRRKSSGRSKTPPWLAASPQVAVPVHVESLVRAKGAELDAKAAQARKRTTRQAPGVALAGDFGRMESMFGAGRNLGAGSRSNSTTPTGMSSRSSSANSYASSHAASAVEDPAAYGSSVLESRSMGDVTYELQQREDSGGLSLHSASDLNSRSKDHPLGGEDDVRTRGVAGRRSGSGGSIASLTSSGGFDVRERTWSSGSTGSNRSNGSGKGNGRRQPRRKGERDRPSSLPPMGLSNRPENSADRSGYAAKGAAAMGRRAGANAGPAKGGPAPLSTPTKGHANKIFEELFGM